MTSRPHWIACALIAVSVFLAQRSAEAQSCHSCVVESPVCEGACGTGYVNAACLPGMGCLHQLGGHIAHLKEINRVVSKRNEAWPKPFACADRQLYFQMWDPMLETGWKSACVFSQRHFVDGTAELNQAGRMKMAAIMRNYPIGQKAFYLDRDRPAELLNERMATLKNRVEEWYGLEQVNEIAFIDRGPLDGSGSRAATLSNLYKNGLQAPVLPIQLGGSTSGAFSSDE